MAANTEQLAEEMQKKLDQLDDLEKKIEEAEAKKEIAMKKFEEDCKTEMKTKLESFGKGLDHKLDYTFGDLEQRIGKQDEQTIKSRQTDILRLNRIIRDVSRGIAKDWKRVYVHLMSGAEFPKEEIDSMVKKIEKNKPTVQSLKALTMWKNCREEIDFAKLIEALRKHEKNELADHVDALLDAEGEELVKFKELPASAISKAPEGNDATQPYVEILTNAKLLALSKKIGPAWMDLSTKLGVPKIDVDSIKESEGLTYKGAFRILYAWKDMTSETDIDQVDVLIEALKSCDMSDVAEDVK